jgi:hypothetical protein
MKTESVTLEIPRGEGKDAFRHSYQKEVAETPEDVMSIAASGRNENEASAYLVRAFNYGNDLILRQKQRQQASKAAEGPEKQIAKAVETLVTTAGFDRETARQIVVKQREAAGLPV